jgi:hypothetical protein
METFPIDKINVIPHILGCQLKFDIVLDDADGFNHLREDITDRVARRFR